MSTADVRPRLPALVSAQPPAVVPALAAATGGGRLAWRESTTMVDGRTMLPGLSD